MEARDTLKQKLDALPGYHTGANLLTQIIKVEPQCEESIKPEALKILCNFIKEVSKTL